MTQASIHTKLGHSHPHFDETMHITLMLQAHSDHGLSFLPLQKALSSLSTTMPLANGRFVGPPLDLSSQQDMQPFQIESQADQTPFTRGCCQTKQRELTNPHNLLDNTNHRLNKCEDQFHAAPSPQCWTHQSIPHPALLPRAFQHPDRDLGTRRWVHAGFGQQQLCSGGRRSPFGIV